MMEKLAVLAVVGPTASGKTGLGVHLAQALGGEVVSADSMQIYRGMAVSTAKPTTAEMRGVPHHLVDYVDPQEDYSVARFLQDAAAAIDGVAARERLPLLVGGTGLYIDSLLQGIAFAEQPENTALRQQLRQQAAREGNEQMHRRLAALDPEYATTLHPNNAGRVLRGIEVCLLTGKTMTEQLAQSRSRPSRYLPVWLGLSWRDRQKLYARIDLRVEQMLRDGLVEEARDFYSRYNPQTAAQAIGCKELLPFLQGEAALEQAVDALKRATRRYAKRQLSWFRRNQDIQWLYCDDYADTAALFAAAQALAVQGLAKVGWRKDD